MNYYFKHIANELLLELQHERARINETKDVSREISVRMMDFGHSLDDIADLYGLNRFLEEVEFIDDAGDVEYKHDVEEHFDEILKQNKKEFKFLRQVKKYIPNLKREIELNGAESVYFHYINCLHSEKMHGKIFKF